MARSSSNAEHVPSGDPAGDRGETRSVLPEPSVDALSYAETRDRVFEALLDQPRQVQQLGRYVVLDTLGRGGMGKVLDAYDPSLDRRVALKVLHRDLAARHRRRLVREAKVMARFSHPHVVQVYEVAEAEGRTFVAMEQVRGQTLGEWMRQRPRPGWRECVRVFVQAGEGLAAAHAKGVVHRDFKPGNALVDEEGRARVLDFGLARTLEEPAPGSAEPSCEDEPRAERVPSLAAAPGERGGLDSPLTRTGSVMGTPAYMAPEQMAGQPADARSDQFAFCVSLYEALYGERPFEGRSVPQLREAMERGVVRAPARGVAVPEALRRVVLRGLAREPEQRWPSMEALLDRLRRRIAPRRQGWVALALLGGLAAIGVGIVYQAEVGQRCEGAETRLEGVWDEARREQVGQAILGTGLSYAPGTWERVAPRLDAYARAWAEAHTEVCEATSVRHEQSAEVMDLRMTCLADRLLALDQAAAVLAEANETRVRGAVELVARLPALGRCDDVAALRAAVPPPEEPRVAEQVEALRRRIERARSLEKAGEYDEALALVRALAPEAESLGYEPLLAEVLHHRGRLTSRSGRFAEAEPDLSRAYELAIEHGHAPIAVGAAADLVWNVGYRQARPEEGLWWARTALPLARSVGEPRLEVEALNSVAAVHELQGKVEEALRYQRWALATWEEAAGADAPDEPYVAYLLSNIGISLDRQGEVEAALGYHRRALAIVESTLGPEHPEIGRTLDDIGVVLYGMGELDAAVETFERALAIKERGLGPTHPSVAYSHNNLGDLLRGRGRDEEALMHLRRSVEIFEQAVGPEHPNIASPLHNLAVVFRDLGRFDEAWHSDQRGLEITEASLGPDHPNVAYNLLGLAETALARDEPAAARPHAERALRIREHHEVSPAELAQALFTVTRACWSEPELRPRAHALAERAHALLLEHEVARRQVERIERWLETHPLP